MSDCIFCNIVAGRIPCAKLLEDDAALAFMDIGPLAPGHAMLIPKGHYETVDQIPADEAAAVLRHLPALVKAVRAATGATGVNVLQNNGRSANQLVPHVHFHIIPRREGDAWHFNWPAGKYGPGEMDDMARRIREGL
ncbi:MAG: HIT family protein [Phycisphaerae bacterium]|nr:HIT family protein [Phycisphaerae bacterium]